MLESVRSFCMSSKFKFDKSPSWVRSGRVSSPGIEFMEYSPTIVVGSGGRMSWSWVGVRVIVMIGAVVSFPPRVYVACSLFLTIASGVSSSMIGFNAAVGSV